jgi:hypothetical protein
MYDQPKVAIRNSKLRISAPYFLLLFILIWSLQNLFVSVLSIPSQRNFDEISIAERKLSGLNPFLPKFGVIGFLTGGGDFRPNVIANRPGTKSYFIAQYVLSPLVLVNSRTPKLVIGDFSQQTNSAGIGAKYQLRIVKDLRSGAILFENK